jgi:hypothetical protein
MTQVLKLQKLKANKAAACFSTFNSLNVPCHSAAVSVSIPL